MERILIFTDAKKIEERVKDYQHICERLNLAIAAVVGTGLKLADNQLSKVTDANYLCTEADTQARQEAQERTQFVLLDQNVDTRKWQARLTEVATIISREVRVGKIKLGYFVFKDGRATIDKEKLEQDLTEANSVYAETEEQAEAWRLAQAAKEKLDAYLSFISKHDVGAPFNFSPVVDADAWGKCGLIMLHKDKAEIDPKALCYIK